MEKNKLRVTLTIGEPRDGIDWSKVYDMEIDGVKQYTNLTVNEAIEKLVLLKREQIAERLCSEEGYPPVWVGDQVDNFEFHPIELEKILIDCPACDGRGFVYSEEKSERKGFIQTDKCLTCLGKKQVYVKPDYFKDLEAERGENEPR